MEYQLGTLQPPGIWHKRNGGGGWGGGHTGLAALIGRNESSETVHGVGMNCGVVETVPVHRCSHKEWSVFVLLRIAIVLGVKASVAVRVTWVAFATVVWGVFFFFF